MKTETITKKDHSRTIMGYYCRGILGGNIRTIFWEKPFLAL